MSVALKSIGVMTRNISAALIGLGTSIVIARTMGPVGLGTWMLLELLLNYSRIFGSPRLEVASVYFCNKSVHSRTQVMWLINVVGVLCGSVVALLLIAGIPILQERVFREMPLDRSVILWLAAFVPLQFLARNYSFFLLAQDDVMGSTKAGLLQDGLRNGLAIVLVGIAGVGLIAMPIAALAGAVAATLYAARKVHRRDPLEVRWSWPVLTELLRFGSKIYAAESVQFLSANLMSLVTGVYLSASALAYFGSGKGKAEYLNQLTTAICTVLYPRIASGEGRPESIREITSVFRLVLFILIALATGGALLIYPAAVLLYGPAFAPLALAFWIVLPGVVIQAAANILRQFFIGIGRPEIPIWISGVPLLLQIALSIVLVPWLGMVGAALTVSLTLAATGTITVIWYKRFTDTSYQRLLWPNRAEVSEFVRRGREVFKQVRTLAWQARS